MIFRIDKQEKSNEKLKELSLKSLIAELPNLSAIFISALMSNSILIWFDFLGSLSAVLHSAFAFLVIISVEIMG